MNKNILLYFSIICAVTCYTDEGFNMYRVTLHKGFNIYLMTLHIRINGFEHYPCQKSFAKAVLKALLKLC